MTQATIENAKEVLEGALDEVEDPEVRYKVRTTLQFLEALQYQEEELLSIVKEDCPDDVEVFSRLRKLGYLE